MLIFEKIAERHIQEAINRGEFENLRGMGKPLPRDEFESLDPDIRIACRILKNANIIPEEIELRGKINSIDSILNQCVDETERNKLNREKRSCELRYNMLIEKRGFNQMNLLYRDRLLKAMKD